MGTITTEVVEAIPSLVYKRPLSKWKAIADQLRLLPDGHAIKVSGCSKANIHALLAKQKVLIRTRTGADGSFYIWERRA